MGPPGGKGAAWQPQFIMKHHPCICSKWQFKRTILVAAAILDSRVFAPIILLPNFGPIPNENKRLLATGPPTPRLYGKFKFWNYCKLEVQVSLYHAKNKCDCNSHFFHLLNCKKKTAILNWLRDTNVSKVIYKPNSSNLQYK